MLLAITVAHRKIEHFNIIDLLDPPPPLPPYGQDLSCMVSQTGDSYGPLGVQFRKKNLCN
jgi:hypothetical protein